MKCNFSGCIAENPVFLALINVVLQIKVDW